MKYTVKSLIPFIMTIIIINAIYLFYIEYHKTDYACATNCEQKEGINKEYKANNDKQEEIEKILNRYTLTYSKLLDIDMEHDVVMEFKKLKEEWEIILYEHIIKEYIKCLITKEKYMQTNNIGEKGITILDKKTKRYRIIGNMAIDNNYNILEPILLKILCDTEYGIVKEYIICKITDVYLDRCITEKEKIAKTFAPYLEEKLQYKDIYSKENRPKKIAEIAFNSIVKLLDIDNEALKIPKELYQHPMRFPDENAKKLIEYLKIRKIYNNKDECE